MCCHKFLCAFTSLQTRDALQVFLADFLAVSLAASLAAFCLLLLLLLFVQVFVQVSYKFRVNDHKFSLQVIYKCSLIFSRV